MKIVAHDHEEVEQAVQSKVEEKDEEKVEEKVEDELTKDGEQIRNPFAYAKAKEEQFLRLQKKREEDLERFSVLEAQMSMLIEENQKQKAKSNELIAKNALQDSGIISPFFVDQFSKSILSEMPDEDQEEFAKNRAKEFATHIEELMNSQKPEKVVERVLVPTFRANPVQQVERKRLTVEERAKKYSKK